MRAVLATFAVVALLATTAGCRSAEAKARAREEKRAEHEARLAEQNARMRAAIPADSPLAKVEFGMSEGEVGSLLGVPDSQSSHTTGKQFIPFNFEAKDTLRTVYYYKGVGRVEFSAGSWGQRNGVVVMEHDPSEPGYRRRK